MPRWAFRAGGPGKVDRAEAIQNELAHLGRGLNIKRGAKPKSLTPAQRQMDLIVILSFVRGSGIDLALKTIIILR